MDKVIDWLLVIALVIDLDQLRISPIHHCQSPALAKALGITIGEPVVDARLSVVDVPRWEHGAVRLLCLNDTAKPLTGAAVVVNLRSASPFKLCLG